MPPDLLKNCEKTFSKCQQFESHDSIIQFIRASHSNRFAPDLKDTGRMGLSDRARTVAMFFWDKSEVAFLGFVDDLRDRYNQEDDLWEQLGRIHNAVRSDVGTDVVQIPFVTVAMTSGEAADLFDGSAFQNDDIAPRDLAHFKQFMDALDQQGCNEDMLRQRYGTFRKDWKPWGHLLAAGDGLRPRAPLISVAELVSTIADQARRLSGSQSREWAIESEFLCEGFFDENKFLRHRYWDHVKQTGGVLIVDSVSLYHPGIRKKLKASEVLSRELVAVIVVSPVDSMNNSVDLAVEGLFDAHDMESVTTRFGEQLDRRCELGVGDERSFRRRLFSILTDELQSNRGRGAHPGNQNIIGSRIRQAPSPEIFGKIVPEIKGAR